jgi:hypothetical protein
VVLVVLRPVPLFEAGRQDQLAQLLRVPRVIPPPVSYWAGPPVCVPIASRHPAPAPRSAFNGFRRVLAVRNTAGVL